MSECLEKKMIDKKTNELLLHASDRKNHAVYLQAVIPVIVDVLLSASLLFFLFLSYHSRNEIRNAPSFYEHILLRAILLSRTVNTSIHTSIHRQIDRYERTILSLSFSPEFFFYRSLLAIQHTADVYRSEDRNPREKTKKKEEKGKISHSLSPFFLVAFVSVSLLHSLFFSLVSFPLKTSTRRTTILLPSLSPDTRS